MEIYLKNIAKIKEASIDLNGITVIAGENNTGKSTVGRVLCSIFFSMLKIDEDVHEYRIQSIFDKIYFFVKRRLVDEDEFSIRRSFIKGYEKMARDLVENIDECRNNADKIKDYIVDELKNEQELISQIHTILMISDQEVFRKVLSFNFNDEFHEQINNLLYKKPGEIKLKGIGQNEIIIDIQDNEVIRTENIISLNTDVIYIDDPFILDILGELYRVHDHKKYLKNKLENIKEEQNPIDGIINDEKLKGVVEKVNSVCDGNMVNVSGEFFYRQRVLDKVIDINIKNISTGLKTFVILKTLLSRGIINENCTLILDEPEIHLHPKWQILFAEIIVLIQRNLGIKVLLNTHSPYFLKAISNYSEKYRLGSRCKYYITRVEKEGSFIDDVTDKIWEIHEKMAEPFRKLKEDKLGL